MKSHLSFCLLISVPLAQSLSAQQEQVWRDQIKSVLFVPNPLPPLTPKTHSQFEPVPGVIAERVTYGTQFGMKVPAILYVPKARSKQLSEKIPALIVVNGHGGDKYSWYSFYSGILYRNGLNCKSL